ncbi:MAG: SIS domain-containing protein [Pseudomonadota bacterium]
MSDDPRFRNIRFDTPDNPSAGLVLYADWIARAFASVDADQLCTAIGHLNTVADAGGQVFMIGNGGSAAIAEHLAADFVKGTHVAGANRLRVQALTANSAIYSAVANDFGFGDVFSRQLRFLADSGDVLVAISSSGNSPNILDAVRCAKQMQMVTIGLCGFNGGALAEAVDTNLHVNAHHYGVVEDVHQSLLHIMSSAIAERHDHEAATH